MDYVCKKIGRNLSGFGLLALLSLPPSPPIPLELPVRSLVRICGGARRFCYPLPIALGTLIYLALSRKLYAYPHSTVSCVYIPIALTGHFIAILPYCIVSICASPNFTFSASANGFFQAKCRKLHFPIKYNKMHSPVNTHHSKKAEHVILQCHATI